MKICNLHLRRRAGVWWICGLPDGEEEQGPYATKGEAEEDRRGLERTYRLLPLIDTAAGRRYFTSFKKRKVEDQ
jgi:protein tyrosine phosphatase (PTP) superfamily phosphohydrolase (DUF442 family)